MSNVKEYAKRALKLAEFEQEVPISQKERRVTVRLPWILYGGLLLTARRLVSTPTGCAQDLIVHAIHDAIEAMGYESFEAAIPDIIKVLGTDHYEQLSSTTEEAPV
jgi:hypothetical protein